MSLEEGFGVIRRVVGGGFPMENEGKMEGGGGGWGVGVGTGKRNGKSMRKLCRNYPLANYPLVSPRPKSSLSTFPEPILAKFQQDLPAKKKKLRKKTPTSSCMGHGELVCSDTE